MDEIEQTLQRIFRTVFDQPQLNFSPRLSADQVEGWDSLAHIRLVISVEREFGIRFTTEEVTGLKNAGELLAVIRKKKSH